MIKIFEFKELTQSELLEIKLYYISKAPYISIKTQEEILLSEMTGRIIIYNNLHDCAYENLGYYGREWFDCLTHTISSGKVLLDTREWFASKSWGGAEAHKKELERRWLKDCHLFEN